MYREETLLFHLFEEQINIVLRIDLHRQKMPKKRKVKQTAFSTLTEFVIFSVDDVIHTKY